MANAEAPITNAGAVPYGFLVMYAMDMYRADPKNLTPGVPPQVFALKPQVIDPGDPEKQRLVDGRWRLAGYVQGVDSLFPAALQIDPGHRTCYGYVLETDDEVVVAIRGTDGIEEWIENGLFLPTQYQPVVPLPVGGPSVSVEHGFWQIYGTLEMEPADGGERGTLAGSVVARLGDRRLTVVGHSLGAALATYLAADLAAHVPAIRLRACLFASPRTGNRAFADLFDRLVPSYRLFNYSLDVVPRVPFGPDYVALARATVITPEQSESRIRFGVTCNHHVVCYCAMLDFERTQAEIARIPAEEEASASCVLGPESGAPSIAKLFHDLIA